MRSPLDQGRPAAPRARPARRAGPALALLLAAACGGPVPRDDGPELSANVQIVEGADRRASDEVVPRASSVFDGHRLRLRAARGETVSFTVWQRGAGAVRVQLAEPQISVTGYEVEWATVTRPSTGMYGGSRGAARYPDGLRASAAPGGAAVYFELAVGADAAPGRHAGVLQTSHGAFEVELVVVDVQLPELGARPLVWAYYDPRELAWQHGVPVGAALGAFDPFELERRCAAMFRAHGVLATPELTPAEWPRRKPLLAGARYVPVLLPAGPDGPDGPDRAGAGAAALAQAAQFWEQALADDDQLAFAIPIDEPRQLARKRQVRELADRLAAARLATGTRRLLLAVTDTPHPIYGDAVDVFISPLAISRPRAAAPASRAQRWTYNGHPPYAGSMVLDAGNADLRSWGWIAWRWDVPLWYVWDALYWHDRHNARRRGLPRPGRAMTADDAVTFDDGEDQGNRDGVLALPGPPELPCRPTLRLKALRQGLQDRLLLQAASCSPGSRERAARLAGRLVPFALGDAASRAATPRVSAAQWSAARGELLELAAACAGAARP